jgi:2-oxoacid dehydrogenases acyltransferase (catalytic domain)
MDPQPDAKPIYFPTDPDPVALTDLGKLKCVYLSDRRAHRDPTIIWGTAVDSQPVADFIVAESRRSNILLSPVHVLVRAVAQSLIEHPHLNRKVIGRRLHDYRQVNIAIPLLNPGTKQVVPAVLEDVENMSLRDIAMSMWNETRSRGVAAVEEQRRDAERTPWQRFWVRVWRTFGYQVVLRGTSLAFVVNNQFRRPNYRFNVGFNGASALVNCLSFPGGSPSMLSFKPSTLPCNAPLITVTTAAPEWRAVVVNREVVAQRVTPLFVKVDHRVAYTHEIAAFVKTICGYLLEPQRLSSTETAPVEFHAADDSQRLSSAA